MQDRPRIQPELSLADKIAEVAAWTIIGAIWAIVLFNYSTISDTIPIHYNAAGEVDGYGDKSGIFTIAIIATVFVIGLSLLNKFPHIFNYSRKITAENALQQYTAATRMIRYIKVAIALTFMVTTITTVSAAYNGATSIGSWILPCLTAIIVTPMIYFGIKMLRK